MDTQFTLSENFKTKNAGMPDFESALPMPSVVEIEQGLQSELAAPYIMEFVHFGLRAFARNNVKAGRNLATSWGEVVALKQQAEAAKGGNGEALALAKEATTAFKLWLESKGVPARGVVMLTKLAHSVKALEIAAPDNVEKAQKAVVAWSETLGDDDALRFAPYIDKVVSFKIAADDGFGDLF